MGLCREIYQEGVRIPPVKLMRRGAMNADVLALLLNNVRTPEEREGDLGAQIAACHTGAERLREVCSRYGLDRARRAAADLLDYSEDLMRAFLERVPAGEYRAEDFLDGDGISEQPVKIAVTVESVGPGLRPGRASKTRCASDDHSRFHAAAIRRLTGSVNAVAAITYSACFYVFRCLLADDVPAAAGLMRPIHVIAPEGTIVNARPPAAVAGGNVETSQRIVDVLLRALAQAIPDRIPAAASGTMNNLTIGGIDPQHRRAVRLLRDRRRRHGRSPRQTRRLGRAHAHDEFAEHSGRGRWSMPIRCGCESIRCGRAVAGEGKFRGGDGIVREIEVLTDCEVTLLADRRSRGPWGLSGGGTALRGRR